MADNDQQSNTSVLDEEDASDKNQNSIQQQEAGSGDKKFVYLGRTFFGGVKIDKVLVNEVPVAGRSVSLSPGDTLTLEGEGFRKLLAWNFYQVGKEKQPIFASVSGSNVIKFEIVKKLEQFFNPEARVYIGFSNAGKASLLLHLPFYFKETSEEEKEEFRRNKLGDNLNKRFDEGQKSENGSGPTALIMDAAGAVMSGVVSPFFSKTEAKQALESAFKSGDKKQVEEALKKIKEMKDGAGILREMKSVPREFQSLLDDAINDINKQNINDAEIEYELNQIAQTEDFDDVGSGGETETQTGETLTGDGGDVVNGTVSATQSQSVQRASQVAASVEATEQIIDSGVGATASQSSSGSVSQTATVSGGVSAAGAAVASGGKTQANISGSQQVSVNGSVAKPESISAEGSAQGKVSATDAAESSQTVSGTEASQGSVTASEQSSKAASVQVSGQTTEQSKIEQKTTAELKQSERISGSQTSVKSSGVSVNASAAVGVAGQSPIGTKDEAQGPKKSSVSNQAPNAISEKPSASGKTQSDLEESEEESQTESKTLEPKQKEQPEMGQKRVVKENVLQSQRNQENISVETQSGSGVQEPKQNSQSDVAVSSNTKTSYKPPAGLADLKKNDRSFDGVKPPLILKQAPDQTPETETGDQSPEANARPKEGDPQMGSRLNDLPERQEEPNKAEPDAGNLPKNEPSESKDGLQEQSPNLGPSAELSEAEASSVATEAALPAAGAAEAVAAPEALLATEAAKIALSSGSAERLANEVVNSYLMTLIVAAWASGLPTFGLTILLGAILGDILWLIKDRLIRSVLKSNLGFIAKFAHVKIEDLKINFSMAVKANIVALNLAVVGIVLIFMSFFGVVLYAGCTSPLGQTISSFTNYKASILGGLGYADVCKNFMGFPQGLSGALSGAVSSTPNNPSLGGTTSGTCSPVVSGDASQANLTSGCFGNHGTTASIIAGHESGGNPAIASTVDICRDANGNPVPYNGQYSSLAYKINGQPVLSVSWGLFQINLTANKIYQANGNVLNCPGAIGPLYTAQQHQCSITNAAIFDQCVGAAVSAQDNINTACQLSSNGTNWGPWKADITTCNISNP